MAVWPWKHDKIMDPTYFITLKHRQLRLYFAVAVVLLMLTSSNQLFESETTANDDQQSESNSDSNNDLIHCKS